MKPQTLNQGSVPYETLTNSLSAYDLSCRMQSVAHATARLHAVETVMTAETALASIGVLGDDPTLIDDLLTNHAAYTARERIAAVLPSQLTHALVVDFDLTHNQARRLAVDSVVSYIALSGSLRDVFDGVLSVSKLMILVRRSGALSLTDVRWLDRSARELDPQMPVETFARRVSELVGTCSNRRQKARNAFATRRVDFERFDNGTGCVCLYGPLTVLEPLMKRVRATAEAILAGRIAPLDVTDIDGIPVSLEGLEIADSRTLDQLIFDLLALVAPGTRVRVDATGSNLSAPGDSVPLSAAEPGTGMGPRMGAGTGPEAGTGAGAAAIGAGINYAADIDVPEFVIVRCPTEGDWLAEQARVSITVPVLTCIDADSLLPGEMEGHSPIPADLVRTILPTQSAFYRLLTDPASGEVLEEVATTYRVSAGMRRTVEGRHRRCAAPGCMRSSTKLDMDHIIPFNHADPHGGGLTVVENLHPICEYHHQLKTAGIITVAVDDDGVERWNYPLGREAIAVVDGNFTEVEAAQQLLEHLIAGAHADEASVTCTDVGCTRHEATSSDWFDDGAPPF